MDDVAIVRRRVADEQLQSLPTELSRPLRRAYAARGIGAAELDTSLSNLLPVSSLDGTAEAAERLALALERGERVLVVGDFDADGATAAALIMTCLQKFGYQDIAYLVPDRFYFGYGLSAALVESALQQKSDSPSNAKPDLIITVDNGISSLDGVATAKANGIDVLITDHHLPGEVLPDAAVIVNPNAPGSEFSSKALAGVGVAFYVMAALGQRLVADKKIQSTEARSVCADCLDLVALGTIADLVPLDYNNRVLVAQGLQRIRAGYTRPGIKALFAAAGRNPVYATPSDLGFAVAPRLNAAGRLEDISVGIECLLQANYELAADGARTLSRINEERKQLQASMQADADLHIDALLEELDGNQPVAACLFDPEWHQGIVGLVATRIRERINRPVIAFAQGEAKGVLKGSGRSVGGVHMRDLLAAIDAQQPGLIERFGGHAMAAGLSLSDDNLQAFTAAFETEVSLHLEQIQDCRQILSDGELSSTELGLQLAEELRFAGPWGQGFPEPVFDGCFELLDQRIVGDKHLKLQLRHPDGDRPIDGIAFFHPELLPVDRGAKCRVAFRLDVNEFRGRRRPQLVVEHIECD